VRLRLGSCTSSDLDLPRALEATVYPGRGTYKGSTKDPFPEVSQAKACAQTEADSAIPSEHQSHLEVCEISIIGMFSSFSTTPWRPLWTCRFQIQGTVYRH